ncbi:MAG: hypothetical protein VW875_18270, partial [Planctomycetaceae bacterium]
MSSTIQKRHHRGILRFCIAFTVTAIASLSNSTTLWGDTVRVPQDTKTIQEGIDAAEDGDIVIVDAGTYKERIQLKPGVTVRSAGDDTKGELGLKRAETTIIDGNVEGATNPGVVMA